MVRWFGILMAALLLGGLAGPGGDLPREGRSCATFVMEREGAFWVGHNLDESAPVPGLVIANRRGLAKSSVPYGQLKPLGSAGDAPRIRWTSRYASLTTNVFGREFPDGGFNEAGLYVGEMTLMKTEWPRDGAQARLYHHQWIQYLLDNYATVEEALASFEEALPEGHCKWHFLLADRGGDAAVVEFLKGEPVIYRGTTLPYPILCNDPYQPEVDEIKMFAGFGGTKDPVVRHDPEDPRFRWAAVMLQTDEAPLAVPDRAFAVLRRLDLGTTRWSVVCDLAGGRMYFRTDQAPRVRWADLAVLDGACTSTPPALDIHQDFEGDASRHFASLSPEANREAVQRAWKALDAGLLGNIFFKPAMARGIARAAEGMECEAQPSASPPP